MRARRQSPTAASEHSVTTLRALGRPKKKGLEMHPDRPVDQTRLALAALMACLVKALDGPREGVRCRFEEEMRRLYHQLGETQASNINAMETLTWTKTFMETLDEEQQ